MVKPCWSTEPDDRPDFETILVAMKMFFEGADDMDEIYVSD